MKSLKLLIAIVIIVAGVAIFVVLSSDDERAAGTQATLSGTLDLTACPAVEGIDCTSGFVLMLESGEFIILDGFENDLFNETDGIGSEITIEGTYTGEKSGELHHFSAREIVQ